MSSHPCIISVMLCKNSYPINHPTIGSKQIKTQNFHFNMTNSLSKRTICLLNVGANELCTERRDFYGAIKYYQLALILCADLEQCHQYGGSFSSISKRKVDSYLKSESLVTKGVSSDLPSLERYASGKIEADEGFFSHTKPLHIISTQDGRTLTEENYKSLESLSFSEIEAVLCFNLGICHTLLHDLDDHKEALLYFERAEDLLERINQISSINFRRPSASIPLDKINVLHNKGLIHFRAERFEDATECYFEAMNLSISKYGPDHISTATALNKIGMIISDNRGMYKGGSSDDALNCLLRSSAIRIQALGNAYTSDRDTATVLNNVGRTMFLENNFEGALSFHLKAYQIRQAVLGENHLDTSVAVFNIGNCYHHLGQCDNAVTYYSFFAKLIFNSKNLELLVEDSVLALEYIARRFQDASSEHSSLFYKLTLESAKKIFAERKTATDKIAHILNRCGNIHFDSSQLQDALDFYKQGLEIEKSIFPTDHVNIATTLTNIARVHQHEGRLKEALEFYKRSKTTFQSNANGAMHRICVEGIISAQLNMGLLKEELGDGNSALELFCEALDIQREEYGNTDYRLSCTLNRIGNIYMVMGNTQAALSSFSESLKIRQELELPTDSVIVVLSNIATAHLQDGDQEKALDYYKQVIELEFDKKATNEEFDTFGVLIIFRTIANILHEHYGKHAEAMHYVEKAISICKNDGPEVVPLGILSKYLGMAGHLQLVLGDIPSAIGYFSEMVRINRKLGFEDWADLQTSGYDLYVVSKVHLHCAPAA